jgi:hypothetical protein
MTREAGKTSVKELEVTNRDIEPMVPAFQTALEELQQVLQVNITMPFVNQRIIN